MQYLSSKDLTCRAFFFVLYSYSLILSSCRNKGLKYPLLVKRLACMVISGAASAESLDILQPSNLSHEMVLEVRTLHEPFICDTTHMLDKVL
jgi:hypothetical protein